MQIKQYSHGQFCWPELKAMDLHKAKTFYQQLFDWGLQENPIDDKGNVYIMLQKNNLDVGAMVKAKSELEKANARSHWLGYIAVDDIAETAAKIEKMGGKLTIEPTEIGSAGKMALGEDPGGARFALWQANQHFGAHLIGEESTVCWNELATRHLEKCSQFYQELFNWQAESRGPDYFYFMCGDAPVAGMMAMNNDWANVPSHWMTYFSVDDCEMSADKATKLGGIVCVPPTDIDGVGCFSVVTDPQGAVFSIIKLVPELQS